MQSDDDKSIFFEIALDMLCIADFDGYMRHVNRLWEKILGWSEAELKSRPYLNFIHPEDRESTIKAASNLSIGQEIVGYDNRYLCKDGSYRWLSWISYPVVERRLIYAVARDITERKILESHLRNSEQQFRSIIEASPMGFLHYQLQENGNLVLIASNPAADVILHLEHKNIIGFCIEQAFPELEKSYLPNKYREIAKKGGVLHDEQLFYADNRISGIFDVYAFQTMPNHCGVSFSDISQRKQAELDLKEREEKLSSILRVAPVGIGVVVNRVLKQVNEHMGYMTEYSAEELVGQSARILYPTDDDYDFVGKEKYEQIRRFGSGTVETKWKTKYGKILNIILSSTPINREDLSKGVIFTALDITDRKKGEEERLELERRMQHAQRLESLGVLAGGIAHDFNNLLMSIMGNIDFALVDLEKASPLYGMLIDALNAAKRATELTHQMLAYSGRGKSILELLDLTSLVKSILSLLKTSISKKATLVLDLKENLGFINADKAQIQQIILNLIINASESLGENNGTIQINTGFQECGVNDLKQSRVVDDLDAGTYLFIEVIDSGCGMEPSVLNHLFEPFFTTKFTGRGLGLSAVLGIVKRHKGAIFVNSEPQKGTKFKALFPKIDTVEPVIKNDGGTKKAESFIKFFHGKVLLIDDDESILKVCESMLKRLGFNVLTAKNGALGLELFKDNRPELDLVILDLTMPEMDGMSTFIEIKRIKPDQRIILSSGFDAHEVSVKFADKGIGGFLQKPYQFNELKGLLEKIYREKSEKKA